MKFRKTLSLFIFSFSSLLSFSQKESPVTLSYGISKTDYKVGDTVYFIINAKIADGWCLYSSEFAADGPIKFDCAVEKNSSFVQAGPIMAYKPFGHVDETWEAEVKIFESVAQFRVPIVIKKAGKITFKANIEGQACKDVCAPITAKIEVDLSKLPVSGFIAADPSVYKHYETHK